jgi:hypothetical protein
MDYAKQFLFAVIIMIAIILTQVGLAANRTGWIGKFLAVDTVYMFVQVNQIVAATWAFHVTPPVLWVLGLPAFQFIEMIQPILRLAFGIFMGLGSLFSALDQGICLGKPLARSSIGLYNLFPVTFHLSPLRCALFDILRIKPVS